MEASHESIGLSMIKAKAGSNTKLDAFSFNLPDHLSFNKNYRYPLRLRKLRFHYAPINKPGILCKLRLFQLIKPIK
ncbi:MAG: hypothetical protein BGP13_13090 [Sphingobacteriales bacterium 40-81]|nr:MAG: hypothetical protein BGP13_13090 [Sphingobacteriales bacterium 40-81]